MFFPFCFGISEVITYSSTPFSKILVNFHMVSNLVLVSPLRFNNCRGSTKWKVQIFSIVFQYILGNMPGVLFLFFFYVWHAASTELTTCSFDLHIPFQHSSVLTIRRFTIYLSKSSLLYLFIKKFLMTLTLYSSTYFSFVFLSSIVGKCNVSMPQLNYCFLWILLFKFLSCVWGYSAACMSAHSISDWWQQSLVGGIRSPWTDVIDGCESPCGCSE